jgi:hypothetical protein
METEEGEPAAL